MSPRRLLLACVGVIALITTVVLVRQVVALVHPPCPGYCVEVTPDGANDPVRDAGGTGYSTTFTVTNTGSLNGTWTWDCGGCDSISHSSAFLRPGWTSNVTAWYTASTSNSVLTLTTDGPALDDGSVNVIVRPVITITAPALTSDTTGVVYSRMPMVQARLFPNDANLDTTTMVVIVGTDTVTALTRRNRGLIEWELDSLRQLSAGTLKKFYVRICLTNGECQSKTRYLKLDDSGKPWVSFAGMPLEAHGRVFAAPFGPGLAVSGAEVETGFSIPGYMSMNTPRSAGLVYSTRQSHPRALVNVDVELSWPAGNPDSIRAKLFDGAAQLHSYVVAAPSCSASVGRRCRMALEGDFASTTVSTARRKWLKVEVWVWSSGTSKTTTDSVEVTLVDRRSSSYGSGWAVAGVMRLDTAGTDMLLVGSTGTVSVYRGYGGVYLPPPGDYSLLVWTGSLWELRFRTGGKLVFDAQGRQTKVVDIDGNQTVIAYSGSTDRVTSITDPANQALSFTYDGSNKISGINHYTVQYNKISVDGSNQLISDTTSSPASTPYFETFRYSSSGSNDAIVLRARVNAIGDSTVVTYSSARPTQVSLPEVLRDTGSTPTRPVIQYAAQELRALGTLVSADSTYVTITDPLGNWTRSSPNRWGASIRSWDALGTLSRASFTPQGFVAWSEGKVADSTRVYHTYDNSGQLVRSYRLRAVNDVVRLDSLVYDANHRITQRIEALGNISRTGYDGEGHVIHRVTPSNDSTHFVYLANGQMDSVRAPGQNRGTQYVYDATWKNVASVRDPDGRYMTSNTYDSHGWVIEVERLVMTRRSGGTTYWDFQRSLTTRNAAGQVTSVRREKRASGAGWPNLSTDTLNYDSVYVVNSRLGRDSLRVNIHGKASRVLYDALGRVRIRQPWFTDHPSERDSFRYDVAGNLRYHSTRRGVLIEHYPDSRDRDTLTVVPGTGNYRQAFGGPNDELTAATIASYVDSIGGVSPDVRWGYSQAGLLLADTAQTNRVASHLYDRYGRDSVLTDINGTWRLKYETARGRLDTIVTPFNDSILYSYDNWGRRYGPTVLSGSNPAFGVSTDYSMAGQKQSLSSGYGAYTVGGTSDIDTSDVHTIARWGWVATHGSGGTVITEEDSLENDGFERLLVSIQKNNASPTPLVVRDTFRFDRDGGIFLGAESRTYDVTNTRMTARAGSNYTYDAAGNLTAAGLWAYGYDALDRLVSVRYNGTLIARYAYDVLSRRIVKKVYNAGPNGAHVQYLRMIYGGGQVIAEANAGDTIRLRYTWGLGADDLVGIHDDSSGFHYSVTQDQLGSVRGISKRDGTWQGTFRYRAYGAPADSAGTILFKLRYRWIGRELDEETGLYYVRARYYDPGSQRFTQEDPSGYSGGLNLYAYGDGNPTNGRDLSGLDKTMDGYDWWAHHCAEYTAGCSGNGGWSRGESEAYWASGFHNFGPSYDQYRSMALVMRNQFDRSRTRWDGAPDAVVTPMDEHEYRELVSAIIDQVYASREKQGILKSIQLGRFLMERADAKGIYHMTSGLNPGDTLDRTIIILNEAAFGADAAYLAHIAIHEYLHTYEGGSYSEGSPIWCASFNLVPSSVGMSQLQHMACK